MKNLRYFLIMLFLVPGYAFAQQDSVVVRVGDLEFPAYPATFGESFFDIFDEGGEVGPAPLAAIEPAIGCEEDPNDPGVFIPAVTNPEELEGNVALISRGACAFVLKAEAAISAGAVGYIVYNDDRVPDDDETLVSMGGDCDAATCGFGAFVSRASGLALLVEEEFGSEASIDPIFINPPPPVATVGTHNTGVVELDVYDYGFIGADVSFAGTGFTFNGTNGLFVSSVLVGVDGNVVSNPYNGLSEWTVVDEVETIAAPFPAPFDDFDTGFVTSFENTDAGLFVTERSYSRDGDAYVVVELEVENTSGSDIDEAYIGLFGDFDVATTSVDDEGGTSAAENLVYVFDPVEDAPYYGFAALGEGVSFSGYSTTATTADDAQLFDAMTMEVDTATVAQERAAVIGTGPYSIAAATSTTVQFAYIAGANEAELIANAQAAQADVIVAAEASAPEGTYVLGSAYPNPVSARTTIGFELPVAQDVTLTVYDVLGRQVATLVDGMRQAGPQSVEFDVSSLPSGVYVYRLEAGSTQLMERMTIVR